jgi:hypothetical protein
MRGFVPNEKTSADMGVMHHRPPWGGTIDKPSDGSSIRPLAVGTGVSAPQSTVPGVKRVEAHPQSARAAARIQGSLITSVVRRHRSPERRGVH